MQSNTLRATAVAIGTAALIGLVAPSASADGLITVMSGANGVHMPGLSVIVGTPRKCAGKACGARVDVGIIRDKDTSKGGGTCQRDQGR
ncbi:hypothetical protein ABT255_03325 [Streptomyces mirabilis]|uniref:hypothetical protein n=1 Tax=Streptomyces mirabilis TaxID=68239 RepID=UPI003328D14F